jgi:hypothetical protein
MAQPIFITIKNMTVTIAKSSPKFWAKPEIFKKTAQSKQSPNKRKHVQSGRTACHPKFEAIKRLARSISRDTSYVLPKS